MGAKAFLSVDIKRVIRKLFIKTSQYAWSNIDKSNYDSRNRVFGNIIS